MKSAESDPGHGKWENPIFRGIELSRDRSLQDMARRLHLALEVVYKGPSSRVKAVNDRKHTVRPHAGGARDELLEGEDT